MKVQKNILKTRKNGEKENELRRERNQQTLY